MSKPLKIPKSLAACADLLFNTRNERLAKQKELEAMEQWETALKEHLINNLKKGDANGIQGKLCRVAVINKEKPTVQDWDKFYTYIKKTGSFELLQRRLADKAVEERWENKKQIPGVGKFVVTSVSINKV